MVKDAVSYWAEEEINAADVNVTEAVFVFPLSSDILYYLTGSGLTVRDGDAVYMGGDEEGPQAVSLKTGHEFKVTVGEFSKIALSRDEFTAEDFLIQYGNKTQQAVPQEVQRTEPVKEQEREPVVAPEVASATASTNKSASGISKLTSMMEMLSEWID
jgi:hypothetical protein